MNKTRIVKRTLDVKWLCTTDGAIAVVDGGGGASFKTKIPVNMVCFFIVRHEIQ